MEGPQKRLRALPRELEQRITRLMEYPKPVRLRIIDEFDMTDLIMAAEADPDGSFSEWLRNDKIWMHVFDTKIVPELNKNNIPVVLAGPDGRKNCLAWYFTLHLAYRSLSRSKNDTSFKFETNGSLVNPENDGKIEVYTTRQTHVHVFYYKNDAADTLQRYANIMPFVVEVTGVTVEDYFDSDYKLMQSKQVPNAPVVAAQIMYKLLSEGYYIQVTVFPTGQAKVENRGGRKYSIRAEHF